MILFLVYYLLKTMFIIVLTLIFLTVLVAIYFKFKLEPIKGVCKSKARLDGKVAIVTGGNSGIGLETARDLANRGAKVVIACRDAKKSAEAIEDIVRTTGNSYMDYKHLDLAKFSSIRSFTDDFNKSYDRLDILVNNAGCAALKPKPTEDGIDIVMQVNYFGPFLLTNLLLKKLIASKPSRIVIVSSWLHNFAKLDIKDLRCLEEKDEVKLYSKSKLCDVLWMKALAKKLPVGVTVNALHPGVVNTDIFKRLPNFVKQLWYAILYIIFKTAKEGAQTTLHLCVDENLEGVSGKYFMECKEASYSKYADDNEVVQNVWNESVAITSN